MSVDTIAAPPLPLQKIIPAYAYQQYADDINVVAFFDAYNTLAQAYLDWMNQTPFGVYTSPNVTGQLLDWIGNGIYGVPRPVFSTLSTSFQGEALDSVPLNTMAINGSTFSSSGSAELANDDYYKRTITWATYLGDGRTFSIPFLRKRIARWLYGGNGRDLPDGVDLLQGIGISVVTSPSLSLGISIPSIPSTSAYFQEAFNAGILAFPFQLKATVTIV